MTPPPFTENRAARPMPAHPCPNQSPSSHAWGEFTPQVKGEHARALRGKLWNSLAVSQVLKTRLRQRMRELGGWTVEQLAEESGVPFETVKGVFGRTGDPRMSTILKLAKALDRDPRWLTGETDNEGQFAEAEAQGLRGLPVRNKIAAGFWRESADAQGYLHDEGPAPPPDAYSNLPQWWEEIDGDSMNRVFPHGAWVRVIDAIALHYQPRIGDMVVIERRRGDMVERTIKRVVLARGKLAAEGASTDPRWNEPLDLGLGELDLDGEDHIDIVGFVPGDAYLPKR